MAYPQPVNILPSPNLSQRSHSERRSDRSYSQKSLGRASMRSNANGIPVTESRGVEASHILDQLQKEIVYLTGGRDRQGGPLLIFPPHRDMYFLPNDITACLKYLYQIPSEESKRRGFTAIIDSRDGSWSNLVTVLGCLKQSLGDYLKQVLVLRQDGMGQRQSSSTSFPRDRGPNIEPQFVNLNRLYTYVDRNQLMASMGGTLMYNHSPWLQNRLGLEKFIRESRAAASHLDTAESEIQYQVRNRGSESSISPIEALQQHRYFQDSILSVPNQVLHQGKDLLQKLQDYSDVAMRGEELVTTLDNLEAQKQVKRMLQYIENRVEKVAAYLVNRDQSLNVDVQRDGVQREIRQVVEWILGPGEKLLASQSDIGDSHEAADVLRKRHEELEIKCTDTYGHYAELRHRVDDLLQESMMGAEDIKAQRDYMDTVCRSFASRLERRRTLLITSVRFHRLTEEFSRKLDDLLEILYNDNIADTADSAQEALNVLQEKVEAINTAASRAMSDGYSLLDEMSRPIKNAFGKDISPDYASQLKHVNQKLEELQERKMRCDDLADVRKLKLQQMLQLRTCEKDAGQAILWIVELCEVMATSHTHIGQTQQETDSLQEDHKRVESTAFSTYEYGKQLLQAGLVLRRSLRLSLEPNNQMVYELEDAWKRFSGGNNERANRLNVASMFLSQSEKHLERVESLMVVVAQTLTGDLSVPEALSHYTRDKQEVEAECQETGRMGKALLERLALPIIVVDGEEKSLSNEDQTASDIINTRLRKMDYKLSELNRYWSEMEQTGQPPSVTPKITKSFKPFPEDVATQRQSGLQRTPSERGLKSGSLPVSRTSSFNRSSDSQRRKRKGPITKHGVRRRTVEASQTGNSQADSMRKNDNDAPDGMAIQNGQGTNQEQIHPDTSHIQQQARPHVSQSYYPKSEEFSRQIPPTSYSYHTDYRPEPQPMWEDQVRPSVYNPPESKSEPQSVPQTYSQSVSEPMWEDQVRPSVNNPPESKLKPQSVPQTYSQSVSEPMWEDQVRPSVNNPPESKLKPQSVPKTYSQSESNLSSRFESQILPNVSNSLQHAREPSEPDTSTASSSKSSSHYIPDTLPMTISQPSVTRTDPPQKIDIRPKYYSSRRKDSPPLNFRDILSRFEVGDADKPKDTSEKEAVQKEISQVMKSRASMLDHEDAIQPRSEIIRHETTRPIESAPKTEDMVTDDGGLKAEIEEVIIVFRQYLTVYPILTYTQML